MALFAFYALSMIGAALLSIMLLRRYADPFRVTALVMLISGYAWLTSLSVVALVPVDAYITLEGSETHINAITILWKISYWSTQALTWAIIPIIQGYVLSGSFTIGGRLKSALRRLWRFWLIVGVLAIAGVLLAAAWGKLHINTLPQLIVLLSNTYGLVAIVALLGYGLVEFPRLMWRRSFPESRLTWHLHRVGRAAVRLEDASKELERCLAVVIITSQQVPRSDPELRKIADSLVAYADTHSPVPLAALAASKVDVEALEENDLDYATNAAGLARLRGRVKLAIAEFVGSRGDYLSFLKKAMELESICKSRQLGVYLPPDGQSTWLSMAEWQYKCTVRPYVQRCTALILAGLSITIVWCEATIGSGRHPDLSPFSLAIHKNSMLDSPFAAQLLIALPLAYCCTAAYFSLFKLGSLGAYHMVPHATWSWSLLLNGSLLARFAAPLAFNYLHVIRMTGGQRGQRHMVFVELMAMEDVPLLGAGFNTWFPLIMVAYVGILTFDVCGACAAKICNSSLVKFLLPSRLRLNGERPEEESINVGQRCIAAEREAGGELGEGMDLFGMGKHTISSTNSDGIGGGGGGGFRGGNSQQRRYASVSGGTAGASSASILGAGGSSSYRREVELGSGGGNSSIAAGGGATGSSNVRQPLFGGSHIRSDHPGGSSGSPLIGPDAADELFASVGGRSPTAKRTNGRNPWD